MSVRRVLRLARAAAFEAGGITRRSRARLDGSQAALLMYHRILPVERACRDAVEEPMYVTPESFARHCDWLAEDFRVLPLGEIAARLAAGRSLPPNACAITFDDGWHDNFEFGLPELERRSLPATVFVVTGRVGSLGAFWPDEVCRRLQALDGADCHELLSQLGISLRSTPVDDLLEHLKASGEHQREALLNRIRERTPAPEERARELMSWEELSRMAAAGIEVESHGASHVILTGLEKDAMERELREARDTLLERGHGAARALAYPSGAFDSTVVETARRLGYLAAVTTQSGLAAAGGDPLCWARIGIHEDISRSRLEFRYAVPGRD